MNDDGSGDITGNRWYPQGFNGQSSQELPFLADAAPVKVELAFDVLRWAYSISQDRSLIAQEITVYNSALEILRLYLSGEMGFVNDRDASGGCPLCKKKN